MHAHPTIQKRLDKDVQSRSIQKRKCIFEIETILLMECSSLITVKAGLSELGEAPENSLDIQE